MKIVKENEIPNREHGRYKKELVQFLSTGERFCILNDFGKSAPTARMGYDRVINYWGYPVKVFVRRGTLYAERIEKGTDNE